VDLTRTILYILLPLSLLLAIALVSQGVTQTFEPYQQVELLQPIKDANGLPIQTQTIAVGPAASQVAIKQLGPMAAGSSTSTARIPWRTRRHCRTSWRCWRSF